MRSSMIKTHYHDNYDILKELSETPNSKLLYKGQPIASSESEKCTESEIMAMIDRIWNTIGKEISN